jgi:hypothetical protein
MVQRAITHLMGFWATLDLCAPSGFVGTVPNEKPPVSGRLSSLKKTF